MKNIMVFNEWEALNNTISPLLKWKKVYVLYKTSGSCSCWSDEYRELCHSVEEAQQFIREMDEDVESYNTFHRCGVGNRRDYRATLVLEF